MKKLKSIDIEAIDRRGKGTKLRQYELIREIFNKCSGNQMRDVHFTEIEAENLDTAMDEVHPGWRNMEWEKEKREDGTIMYRINQDGLLQRYSFTEV